MIAFGRLIWIEIRRAPSAWLLIPAIAVAIFFYTENQDPYGYGVVLWLHGSMIVGKSIWFVGPVAGRIAALLAIRDRQRGTDELLATTSRPASHRELGRWAGIMAWAVSAYLTITIVVIVQTARGATWGGPSLEPITLGFAGMVACAALGYAAGAFIPSRLTAALVPIVLFLMIGIDVQNLSSALTHLSPSLLLGQNSFSLFQPPSWALFWPQIAWLAGLSSLALLVVIARGQQGQRVFVGAGLAAVVAIGGAVVAMRTDQQPAAASRSPELTCAQGTIPVCVHPAYEVLIDSTAQRIGPFIEPIVGLPGGPNRVATLPGSPGMRDDGTLVIPLYVAWDSAEDIALGLVSEAQSDSDNINLNTAQKTIAIWLARRDSPNAFARPETAGEFDWLFDPGERGLAISAAKRFAGLSERDQRDWLAAHWGLLLVGNVEMDALP